MKKYLAVLAMVLFGFVVEAQTGMIEFLWYDFNYLNPHKEIVANFKLNVRNLRNDVVYVGIYLYTADGVPVKDKNNNCCDGNGNVRRLNWTKPLNGNFKRNFNVELPYSEFHALPGTNTYYFEAELRVGNKLLDKITCPKFVYTKPAIKKKYVNLSVTDYLYDMPYAIINLYRGGKIEFIEYDKNDKCVFKQVGNYYIDEFNIINITWSNGNTDAVKLEHSEFGAKINFFVDWTERWSFIEDDR